MPVTGEPAVSELNFLKNCIEIAIHFCIIIIILFFLGSIGCELIFPGLACKGMHVEQKSYRLGEVSECTVESPTPRLHFPPFGLLTKT